MSHYAIGDIQGCYTTFQQLLEKIQFSPPTDQLWLTGDLVNRGPHSLKVLRFLKALSPPPIIVLGNHDLHLLAVAYGAAAKKPKDTFDDILQAKDGLELCDWLRHQPLLYHNQYMQYAMTHAGILPEWSLTQAQMYAKEVEHLLQSNGYKTFLLHLYGDLPDRWSTGLTGWDRYRFITNSFTRMRFCFPDGRLNFDVKTAPGQQSQSLIPWYNFSPRSAQNIRIIFGHWAALNGQVSNPQLFALDTGCVWGNYLTAMRLEDQEIFRVKA